MKISSLYNTSLFCWLLLVILKWTESKQKVTSLHRFGMWDATEIFCLRVLETMYVKKTYSFILKKITIKTFVIVIVLTGRVCGSNIEKCYNLCKPTLIAPCLTVRQGEVYNKFNGALRFRSCPSMSLSELFNSVWLHRKIFLVVPNICHK